MESCCRRRRHCAQHQLNRCKEFLLAWTGRPHAADERTGEGKGGLRRSPVRLRDDGVLWLAVRAVAIAGRSSTAIGMLLGWARDVLIAVECVVTAKSRHKRHACERQRQTKH